MFRRPLTRRETLRLGLGALALGALRPPAGALAARPALFELPLPAEGARAASAGWRTTAVLHAPRRFDLVGLRWARGSALEAQVRARPRGGRWTPWAPLHVLGDHGPDDGRPLAGTDPAFVGTADELQLRLRGTADGLHARFVRALPTATAAQRITARLRRRQRPSARVAATARQVQGPSPPRIITRTEWGADSVPPRSAPGYGTVQAAFVHHTVNANDYGPEDSAGIVLGIARYHRDSNGWNDIGYNFLVDRYGQVFEGRAGGIEAAVIGAQAQGYNAQSTGIACLGTFSAVAQTEAGMDALARLIGWKLSLHGVPVQGEVVLTSAGGQSNRYPTGTPVTLERVSGHRDGDQTSCPGDVLYGQLADLRTRAAGYAGPVSGLTLQAPARQAGTAPVAIAGLLRFADGSSPAGAAVAIEYTAAGSPWTPVTAASCGADGAWRTSLAIPRTGRVRAVFAGDVARGRLESAPVDVAVVPVLTLGTNRRRARRGRRFAVSGRLDPPQAVVTCVLQRQVGRRWVTVQRKRIGLRRGRYATTVRPRVAGRYRVTIQATGATKQRLLRALR